MKAAGVKTSRVFILVVYLWRQIKLQVWAAQMLISHQQWIIHKLEDHSQMLKPCCTVFLSFRPIQERRRRSVHTAARSLPVMAHWECTSAATSSKHTLFAQSFNLSLPNFRGWLKLRELNNTLDAYFHGMTTDGEFKKEKKKMWLENI